MRYTIIFISFLFKCPFMVSEMSLLIWIVIYLAWEMMFIWFDLQQWIVGVRAWRQTYEDVRFLILLKPAILIKVFLVVILIIVIIWNKKNFSMFVFHWQIVNLKYLSYTVYCWLDLKKSGMERFLWIGCLEENHIFPICACITKHGPYSFIYKWNSSLNTVNRKYWNWMQRIGFC